MLRLAGKGRLYPVTHQTLWGLTPLMLALFSNDVAADCSVDRAAPLISLNYIKLGDFEVRTPTPFSIDPHNTELQWQGEHWQARHHYFAFDFPRQFPDEPMTNGHVHTLQFGYATQQEITNTGTLHWSAIPTISVSSNQLKNPDKLETESIRLDGHVIWEQPLQNQWSWFAGACLDALSGEHEVIPTIGLQHQSPRWLFSLSYPRTQIQYMATASVALLAQWSVSGHEWNVLDADLRIRSDFHYEARQVKLGIRIGSVDLAWRHVAEQKILYLARNGTNMTARLDDTSGIDLRYTHHF